MAPWGLGLCEGLLCPSMSECLSVSLFLVGGLSGSSRERKGFLCCSLGREMRYVHSAPAGTSCLFWHPQYTAHRDAVSLCKEKWKFCWQQGQWFPPWHSQPAVMLATGVHAHPQGQGFVTDLCWSRICFIPSLIFCVAEDTGQFKFIEDWGPRDALHGRALYLHFHPSSVLWDWKLCLTPCRLPPRVPHVPPHHISFLCGRKNKFREGFKIYLPPVHCFPTNIFNFWYWCGWISLPYACASLASHSSNLRKISAQVT